MNRYLVALFKKLPPAEIADNYGLAALATDAVNRQEGAQSTIFLNAGPPLLRSTS